MRETLSEMMSRIAAGVQGPHWVRTSIGTVNTRNKNKLAAAARKLMEKRASEKNG